MNGYALTSCQGKQKLGAARAKDVARRMRQKDRAVSAYFCRNCGTWHVGSRAPSLKGPRDAFNGGKARRQS